MRLTLSFVNCICRFVLLLLIVPLCLARTINTNHPPFNASKIGQDTAIDSTGTDQKSQQFYLTNFCTDRYMRIKRTRRNKIGVDARGREPNRDSVVNITPTDAGLVKIQGSASGLFLCFTKNGKLRAKRYFNDGLCTFRQKIVNGYDEFSLDKNPNWYVGFRSNRKKKGKRFGKPLPGYMHKYPRKTECFRFVARRIVKEIYQPFDWGKTEYDPEGELTNPSPTIHRRRHPKSRRRRRKGRKQRVDR